MHDVEIRQEIVDRVLARRNRLHLFESLDPTETALGVSVVWITSANTGDGEHGDWDCFHGNFVAVEMAG